MAGPFYVTLGFSTAEIASVTKVFGLGAIIGSGIFALVANMAAIAGPGMLISIFIAGAITLLLALCYAELGSTFPLTGGPYALPRLAMGDLVGFVMGWGYFLYLFVGTGKTFFSEVFNNLFHQIRPLASLTQ